MIIILIIITIIFELPLLSYHVYDGVPTPPVTVISKSGFITPPSHMSCDCNVDIIIKEDKYPIVINN